MEVIQSFLNALPSAATSPYAYAAYVLALAAWVVSLWVGGRPERESRAILEKYRDDKQRNLALAQLLGQAPPEGLPKRQILEWVNAQTRAKSRTYFLVAYLATLVAIIVIVVVALVNRTEASPGQGPTVRLSAAEGGECLPIPAGAKVTVTAEGATPQEAIVAGCEARFDWALDWRRGRQARVAVSGAGTFERDAPDRAYRLGDALWVVALRPSAKAPRLLVQLFDYAASEGVQRDRLDQFQAIVRNKIQMLVESLAARHPQCRYVSGLRIVRAGRQLAASPDETLLEWRASNALAFFSGLLFKRDADLVVRSQPYFGELVSGVPEIGHLQLDLKIDPNEFGQTTDSHSLALLFALAMDARRLGYSRDVVFLYLSEAVSVARGMDSTTPGIGVLKRALRDALGQMGAPVSEDL